MNVEVYDFDSLRKLVREIQKENKELEYFLMKREFHQCKAVCFQISLGILRNAYPDQWKKLFDLRKLSLEEIEQLIAKWQSELYLGKAVSDYAIQKNRGREKKILLYLMLLGKCILFWQMVYT